MYGDDFVKDFLEYASGRRRANPVINVTNIAIDKQKLLTKGFRLAMRDSVADFWVHPSGYVYHIIRASTKVSSKAPVTKQTAEAVEDPALVEARESVEGLTTQRDRIIAETMWLQNNSGHHEYCHRYKQYWSGFDNWQNQLNYAIEYAKSFLMREVEPQNRSALEAHVKRLEDLFTWKQSEWPALVRGLQPCK
jgi:hypothetical protein